MKAILLGVERSKGIAKESRRPYDIVRFRICSKAEDYANEDMTRTARGFNVAEVEATDEAFALASTLSFPCFIDLDIDQTLRFGKLVPVVAGFDSSSVKPLF